MLCFLGFFFGGFLNIYIYLPSLTYLGIAAKNGLRYVSPLLNTGTKKTRQMQFMERRVYLGSQSKAIESIVVVGPKLSAVLPQ